MNYSVTVAESESFTVTHARKLASKVATDLLRIQRFYDRPSYQAIDDYYDPATVPESDDPVRAFDPVNPENNVGRHYTNLDRDVVVDAALDAGDAIDSALRATTKGETVRFWRKVLGPNFQV